MLHIRPPSLVMSMVIVSAAFLVIQVSHQNTDIYKHEEAKPKPNRRELELERAVSPHKTKSQPEKRKSSQSSNPKSRSPKLTKDILASDGSSGAGSNSSYVASSERQASELSEPSERKQSADELLAGRSANKHRQVAKAAALVLAPSLESIAMRIVSSAASKSVGRSRSTPTKLSSSGTSGGAGESFLASLSSSLISTALSQLVNLNSSLASPGVSQSGSSSWPSKLSPLLNSLASLSSSGDESSSSASSSSQSFLTSSSSSGDLAASSSSVQPTSILHYNSPSSLASGKPQSPKQYSPTMLGIVNLARYVLGKFERLC